MFRFKVSKFKNAAPKIPKRDQCFTDVPVGTLMNSCGNHIAASCKLVAFNCELGGGHGIGVLGIEDYGRQSRTMPIIHGHADFVSDMCFSPFDDCLLATGSFDGDVKLWKLPDDGLEELMNNPAIHLPSSSRRIDNVLFHPSAENVLAVTSSNSVQIYDLVGSQLKYEIANESDDLPFQSMDWKSDGSLLVTSCRDTKLRIIDPRASAITTEAQGHPGVKDSRTVWLGNTDHVLSTGFGSQRERIVGIWDARNFKSPVAAEPVDNAPGSLMPFYDVDTNMLLLASKGDSKIFFYEIAEGTKITLACADNLDTQSSGMARIPKRAVNLMAAEVNRLMQLTKNAIIPISYIVPRRSYNDFYPELFPDTVSGEPSMTAKQWFDGANEPMKLIKLDPKKNPRKPAAKAKEETPKPAQQKVDTPKPQEPKQVKVEKAKEPPKKVEQPKAAASPKASPKAQPKHAEPKPAVAKFQKFRVSKFKHVTGKPLHKSHNIENVQKFDQSLSHESDGLQAYNDIVAYPIAGPGGQIAVVKLSSPGRLPDTGVPVLQNPSALLDFSMDPFDNYLIAAACEDSVVRIWRVPEEGLLETMNEPAAELAGHSAKVNIVRYHPCAKGVLATASYDCDVKIWDVNSGSEIFTLEQHPEPLLAMAWHPDGHLLATIARDMKLRVFDPRKGAGPIQVGDGPPGPRGARIVWGGPDCNWLVVSGFSKSGHRGLYVYDSKDLSKAVASAEFEPSPATLMLFYDEGSSTVFATGKGDRAVLAYEISSDPPHIFQLSSYNGANQHQGIAFLRKDLCNVREIEFAKAVRVSKSIMEQVSFTVPRVKKNFFQDDIFPEARVTWEASMTCEEWMNGANTPQRWLDLRPADMQPLHMAPEKAATKKFDNGNSVKDPKSSKQQKEDLMDQMMGKLSDVDDGRPLEQDAMEGVEEGEWDE